MPATGPTFLLTADDAHVAVAFGQWSSYDLQCYDLRSGAQLWSRGPWAGAFHPPLQIFDDRLMVAGLSSTGILSLRNGTLLGQLDLENVPTMVAFRPGRIFTVNGQTVDGRFGDAVSSFEDPSLRRLWQRFFPDRGVSRWRIESGQIDLILEGTIPKDDCCEFFYEHAVLNAADGALRTRKTTTKPRGLGGPGEDPLRAVGGGLRFGVRGDEVCAVDGAEQVVWRQQARGVARLWLQGDLLIIGYGRYEEHGWHNEQALRVVVAKSGEVKWDRRLEEQWAVVGTPASTLAALQSAPTRSLSPSRVPEITACALFAVALVVVLALLRRRRRP